MWPVLFLIGSAWATQYSHNCLLFIPQYDISGAAETIPELEVRINVWLLAQNGSLHITSEGFIDLDADSITEAGELKTTWRILASGSHTGWVTRIRDRQLCFYNTSDIIMPDGGSVIPPPYPDPISKATLPYPSRWIFLLGLTLVVR